MTPQDRRAPPRFASRVWRRAASGFTLIELMIVVAIVGVLAAIAIPQYQIYTGKAQIAEALAMVSGRKTAIAEQYAVYQDFYPLSGGVRGIPDNLSSGAGKYVESLVVTSGTITATMRNNNVSPCVVGANVILAPIMPGPGDMNFSWTCSTNALCKPETCA